MTDVIVDATTMTAAMMIEATMTDVMEAATTIVDTITAVIMGVATMIADMMTAAIMDVVTATAVTITGLTPVPSLHTVTLMVIASERLKSSGKYTLFVNNLIFFFMYYLYIQNGRSNKNLRDDIRAYIIKFSNILSGL